MDPNLHDLPTAKFLESLSQSLPTRVIYGKTGPYLSRYTLRDKEGGGHIYLHFFHRSDEDLELHNHPWSGRSLILTGGYMEVRRTRKWPSGENSVSYRKYPPGDINVLEPETYHRIDLLTPKEGCWTLFETQGKEQSWGFWDRHTNVTTPWREFLAAKGK